MKNHDDHENLRSYFMSIEGIFYVTSYVDYVSMWFIFFCDRVIYYGVMKSNHNKSYFFLINLRPLNSCH